MNGALSPAISGVPMLGDSLDIAMTICSAPGKAVRGTERFCGGLSLRNGVRAGATAYGTPSAPKTRSRTPKKPPALRKGRLFACHGGSTAAVPFISDENAGCAPAVLLRNRARPTDAAIGANVAPTTRRTCISGLGLATSDNPAALRVGTTIGFHLWGFGRFTHAAPA
jgi:hypothetical protein